jgi:hypothetical protein
MIRHLLHQFSDDVLRLAVTILAHATPHPDILYHRGNMIPQSTCDAVCRHLKWSQAEITTLMKSASWPEWHRGGYGQSVYSILCVDRAIHNKMGDVAIVALQQGDEELAFSAMYLSIYWARHEGRQMYEGFVAIDKRFGQLPFSAELNLAFENQDSVYLFE